MLLVLRNGHEIPMILVERSGGIAVATIDQGTVHEALVEFVVFGTPPLKLISHPIDDGPMLLVQVDNAPKVAVVRNLPIERLHLVDESGGAGTRFVGHGRKEYGDQVDVVHRNTRYVMIEVIQGGIHQKAPLEGCSVILLDNVQFEGVIGMTVVVLQVAGHVLLKVLQMEVSIPKGNDNCVLVLVISSSIVGWLLSLSLLRMLWPWSVKLGQDGSALFAVHLEACLTLFRLGISIRLHVSSYRLVLDVDGDAVENVPHVPLSFLNVLDPIVSVFVPVVLGEACCCVCCLWLAAVASVGAIVTTTEREQLL